MNRRFAIRRFSGKRFHCALSSLYSSVPFFMRASLPENCHACTKRKSRDGLNRLCLFGSFKLKMRSARHHLKTSAALFVQTGLQSFSGEIVKSDIHTVFSQHQANASRRYAQSPLCTRNPAARHHAHNAVWRTVSFPALCRSGFNDGIKYGNVSMETCAPIYRKSGNSAVGCFRE